MDGHTISSSRLNAPGEFTETLYAIHFACYLVLDPVHKVNSLLQMHDCGSCSVFLMWANQQMDHDEV